jgi:predicted ester cyclase
MTRAELQACTDRFINAMNRHDPEALAALYAVDATIESPMFATLHGRAAIADSFRNWFKIFPDVMFAVETVLIDPPGVSLTTRNTATQEGELFGLPPTRRHVEFVTTRIVTYADGLIASERRIYDFTGLLVQLGVLRARPAKPV